MNLIENPLLNRRSLHAELTDSLRDMIVSGKLEPGAKVPEKELCDLFEVSRTPMREALKVLAADGLIVLAPNRGAWISRISVRDLEEFLPVMGALEALSGELACRHITDDELARIRELHDRMRGHYERRERPPYFELNQQIHGLILSSARNNTLSDLYRSLAGRVRRARFVANMTDARWDRAMAEHEEIMCRLEDRNGPALAILLRDHLRNKLTAVRDWLVRQDDRRMS